MVSVVVVAVVVVLLVVGCGCVVVVPLVIGMLDSIVRHVVGDKNDV